MLLKTGKNFLWYPIGPIIRHALVIFAVGPYQLLL